MAVQRPLEIIRHGTADRKDRQMARAIHKSVWDDSDPFYAPFMKQIRGAWYWVPSRRYVEAGYAHKTVRLDDPTPEGNLARAAQCRRLTRDLLTWWATINGSAYEIGTWGWLAHRYLTDDHSAVHDVRAGTRDTYRRWIETVTQRAGDQAIDTTSYAVMACWTRSMRAESKSADYIKRWWTHFGLIVSHGIRCEVDGCMKVKAVRSEMRIKAPAPKSVTATREQVRAIVAEADTRGMRLLSLAVLMRFELLLRGVDIYGEWAPAEGRKGGVQHNGMIWDGGLTWDMIAPDLSSITKVVSKTRDRLPEAYTWSLAPLPEIRARLGHIQNRVGPVFVCDDGLPPRNNILAKQFATVRAAVGLSSSLKMMDLRSSGITEAKGLVSPFHLRDASQHTQISTTDRYVRGRSDAANAVVEMRRGNAERG
jgi:hypothetical protein